MNPLVCIPVVMWSGLLTWPTVKSAVHQSPVPPNLEAEQQIDQLVNVGKALAGAHPTAWANEFMAIDEEPKFQGGILGSEKPVVDPAMKKLVQMGLKALPSLIAHLNDDRGTHLGESHEAGFGGVWYSDEYDPRYSDPALCPKGVNRLGNKLFSTPTIADGKYTIRVGDLCYVAIGQIVNRRLTALRYQPTSCEVINSPVHTPALAAAVEADWQGLTPEAHKKQLEDDANNVWPYAAPEAIKRMLYYYPSDGEQLAVRMLNRKLYDEYAIWNFVDDKMMKVDSVQAWNRLRREAVVKYGQDGAELIPHWIHWSNWETSTNHPKKMQDRASRLLKALYPNYSPYRNVAYRVVDLDDQNDLVEGLPKFASKRVDAAVQDLFERALRMPPPQDKSRQSIWSRHLQLDDLVIACAKRMAGKGYNSRYVAYFEGRLKVIKKAGQNSEEGYRLAGIHSCLKLLRTS